MRFSFNWLKKYLNTDLSLEQIAENLTAIGLEVEGVLNPEIIFKNFKLVRIQKAEKHPNADKLKVCSVVDAGGNSLQIVCGAPNAREGLIAILALPGAIIPVDGQTLKKSKIRGLESQGMMCSSEELKIETDNSIDGIVEVPSDTPLTKTVGDVLGFDGGIIDVSITPNRGDCFSVKGIARDLAAAGVGIFNCNENFPCVKSKFKFPIIINSGNNAVLSNHAPQMSFRVIREIKNQESPAWLKEALKNAGMNSISAIVDIANYYMIDSGNPLQIYDLDKIEGNLGIRLAKRNEKFTDFSGKQYVLEDDMLVSEDRSGPICLLGIKSGSKIACDENTKNILIEAAVFNPVSIAKTGSFLDAISDSRTRFERGIDRTSCIRSLEEVTKLLIDTCGGSASEIFTIGEERYEPIDVKLCKEKLKTVSGCDIEWDKVKSVLQKLGLKIICEDSDSATFSTPSWRYDLSIEEDLIEEVLRINGYDNIKEKPLNHISENLNREDEWRTLRLKKILAFRGMSEAVTYSFTKKEYAEAFKENDTLLHIINYITSDFEVMRSSLLPNLILTAIRSLNYGEDNVSLFEVGNTFRNSFEQTTHISGLRAGAANSRNWLNKKRKFDVFDIKKDVYAILDFYGINLKNIRIEIKTPSYYHPSRSGAIYLGKKLLGYFGELHPKINRLFGITERIECFEILPSVSELGRVKRKNYNEKIFPKIERDFSFVFGERDSVGEVANGIYKLDERISKVDIFDSFKINSIQKSIGITIVLEASNRTLTEEEAAEISDKVIKHVEKFGGQLRSK